MRHLAITIGTAALVVAAFLASKALRKDSDLEPAPVVAVRPATPESRPDVRRPDPTGLGSGTVITGASEIEQLHRRHGKVGDAMRDFLLVTRGGDWHVVDKARMQQLLHTLRYNTKEEDVPYLRDLFDRTPDRAFRWWFSWLVPQLGEEMRERFPGELFVEPMTEVYRIDPARGYVALSTIDKPEARERMLKLLDAEGDPDMRRHAIAAFAHSDWTTREETLLGFARESSRDPAERMEAITQLGLVGVGEHSLNAMMELALGPAQPVTGLKGHLAATHPVPDVRSAAVLAVLQRGDQEAARRLLQAADAPDADPKLTAIVDQQLVGYVGPDLSEFIYDRARRRGVVSGGEVAHLLRDLDRIDCARLREVLPLAKEPETKDTLQKVIDARCR